MTDISKLRSRRQTKELVQKDRQGSRGLDHGLQQRGTGFYTVRSIGDLVQIRGSVNQSVDEEMA